MLTRLISCQNMTMAQFAAQLPNLAGGYVRVSVVDATELTEAYDFSLAFSAIGLVRNNPALAAGGTAEGGASDPSGAVPLPEAINKQLGLKLELKKRPIPVLVIDHIDEKPTDN